MATIQTLAIFVEQHQVLSYTLLFIGVLLEGEFALITAGVLSHLGAFQLFTVLPVTYVGAITKPVLGYYLGIFMHRKFPESRFLKFIEKKIMYFLPHFKERPFWSVFISKFIYGVNHLTLVIAGYWHIDFKKFIKAEIFSTTIWLIGLISIGYFFSRTAFGISHDVRKVSIFLLIFLIGFIILQQLLTLIYDVYKEIIDDELPSEPKE
ncbi:MAG: DedA family protein [Candidatus Paceibacterota bacterium]|jgi:membrane protein DedA with SNARE-associated domain